MSINISNKKIILRFMLFPLVLGSLLFIPANTLDWPAAWIYIIIYMCFGIMVLSWLRRNNPELLKERMIFLKKTAHRWDKIIVLGSTVFFVALYAVPGFEFRYQGSQMPIILNIIGFVGIVCSFVLIFLVMRENTYLSRVVEIQKERGHIVITTGPYKFVRHPMYVGVITMFFCTSLVLGSFYGLIPALLLTIIIGIRTHFEDKMLHKELPGYKEYAEKTRYRILPGIW
ncbi:methyltransferase family protein [[Eubacterium] cellulosolvens]